MTLSELEDALDLAENENRLLRAELTISERRANELEQMLLRIAEPGTNDDPRELAMEVLR